MHYTEIQTITQRITHPSADKHVHRPGVEMFPHWLHSLWNPLKQNSVNLMRTNKTGRDQFQFMCALKGGCKDTTLSICIVLELSIKKHAGPNVKLVFRNFKRRLKGCCVCNKTVTQHNMLKPTDKTGRGLQSGARRGPGPYSKWMPQSESAVKGYLLRCPSVSRCFLWLYLTPPG